MSVTLQRYKKKCRYIIDPSDYLLGNIYGIPLVNENVLGRFKDDFDGKIMTALIVGLRIN